MAQFEKLTGQNRNLSTFCKIGLLQGAQRPSLRNFSVESENKILGHFIDFGSFCMTDITYFGRQKRYLSTNSNQDAEKGH